MPNIFRSLIAQATGQRKAGTSSPSTPDRFQDKGAAQDEERPGPAMRGEAFSTLDHQKETTERERLMPTGSVLTGLDRPVELRPKEAMAKSPAAKTTPVSTVRETTSSFLRTSASPPAIEDAEVSWPEKARSRQDLIEPVIDEPASSHRPSTGPDAGDGAEEGIPFPKYAPAQISSKNLTSIAEPPHRNETGIAPNAPLEKMSGLEPVKEAIGPAPKKDADSGETVVKITIGRILVRAAPEPPTPVRRQRPAQASDRDLEVYLERRRGGSP